MKKGTTKIKTDNFVEHFFTMTIPAIANANKCCNKTISDLARILNLKKGMGMFGLNKETIFKELKQQLKNDNLTGFVLNERLQMVIFEFEKHLAFQVKYNLKDLKFWQKITHIDSLRKCLRKIN